MDQTWVAGNQQQARTRRGCSLRRLDRRLGLSLALGLVLSLASGLLLPRPAYAVLNAAGGSCPLSRDNSISTTIDLVDAVSLVLSPIGCFFALGPIQDTGSLIEARSLSAVFVRYHTNDTHFTPHQNRLTFHVGSDAQNLRVKPANALRYRAVKNGDAFPVDAEFDASWPLAVAFDFTPLGSTQASSYYFTLQRPGTVSSGALPAFQVLVGRADLADEQALQRDMVGLGTGLFGWQMGNMAQHRAGERIARAMSGGEGGADFSALKTAKADGWTALDSDQAMDLYQDWQTERLAAKLEGLDLEALGTDTAGLLAELFGPARDPALNWYTAGALASFDKQGSAAFDGYAQLWTAGADYRFSPDFVAGASLNYEYAKLDFDLDQDGWQRKQGWRGDLYAGWALMPDLVAEALVSYAHLDTTIVANFDDGKTDSDRWLASLGLAGAHQALGLEARPYARLIYVSERLDGYTTGSGVAVAEYRSTFAQGQGGLELRAPEAAIWGLTPSIGLQGAWDWQHESRLVLASGQTLRPDDWGLSWAMGLNGQVSGFAPGSWIGGALEGAEVELRLQNSDFGRNIDARSFEWSLSLPLN